MRMGVNARRSIENRRATRNERVVTASRWFFRRGLKVTLIVAIVAGAAYFSWQGIQRIEFAKFVLLKKIEIEGNRLLAWEDVLSTAGIELGQPMLDLPMDSIQQQLERLDLVKTVKVERKFPTTLRIQIEEAQPLFLVGSDAGWSVYSDKGTKIPMHQDLGMQLPVVAASAKKELQQAVVFLRNMRQADPVLYMQVSQVVVNLEQQMLEVFFRHVNHKVWYSPNANAAGFAQYKLLVLALSKNLQNAKIVDMRFPGFAIAKSGNREKQNG